MKDSFKVLLAISSNDLARLLLEELRRGGLEVHPERVDSVASLKESLSARSWDAVLSEEALARLALSQLRDGGSKTPLLIISEAEERLVPLMEAGARDILSPRRLARLVPALRRELEAASTLQGLAHAVDEFEIIFNSIPAYIFYKDEDNRLLRANQAYIQALGVPEAEMRPETPVSMSPPEVAAGYLVDDREVLRTGKAKRGIIEKFSTRGGMRWVNTEKIPYRDKQGKLLGVIGFASDITELKTAQEERERLLKEQEQFKALRESDRLKDEFLSLISHEMRTPLNAITGFGSLLEDEISGSLNSEQHSFVRKILDSADHVIALINDLLDSARIQAGKFTVVPQPEELSSLVEEVIGTMKPLALKKSLTLESRIVVPCKVDLDRQRIYQVLANLLSNAIKFTPAGGRIELRASLESDKLVIEITDTGIGIADENLSRLFTPFTQLDMSATRPFTGTGLGLSITKGIVKAHQGTIQAQSAGVGQGSTFRIEIPIHSA